MFVVNLRARLMSCFDGVLLEKTPSKLPSWCGLKLLNELFQLCWQAVGCRHPCLVALLMCDAKNRRPYCCNGDVSSTNALCEQVL